MDESKILYSEYDGVHFLRFQGTILHNLAPTLDQFLQMLEQRGGPARFVLDLTDTRNIDSTMLGLLARIAKRANAAGEGPPTLVCPNDEIIDLLMGIGFDEVFQLVSGNRPPLGDAHALIPAPTDKRALAQTMWDAHQELILLKEGNRLLFKDVMELLRTVLDEPRSATPS